MKYIFALLVLLIGFLFILGAGTHLDVLRQHQPRYEPRTYSFGPASYTENQCVENCPPR